MWGVASFNKGNAFLNNFEWKITSYSRNKTTQIGPYPFSLQKHTWGILLKKRKQRKKPYYYGRNSFSNPKVFLSFYIQVLFLPSQVQKCLISVNTPTIETIAIKILPTLTNPIKLQYIKDGFACNNCTLQTAVGKAKCFKIYRAHNQQILQQLKPHFLIFFWSPSAHKNPLQLNQTLTEIGTYKSWRCREKNF